MTLPNVPVVMMSTYLEVNWLLFGLFQWDLVGGLFGGMDNAIARVVYVLVVIAAIYCLTLFKKAT
ncbi:DUF378 domain-containing protein [Paenisporosarcina macmurdoensis]|uniref:DUF378 domain-containing protein n=1 Tax=Paenisporosarcina macmurdoensis TaxID=212659 RepID=A0ABW1L7I8_9BACL